MFWLDCLLSCISCLYILEINPLSVVSFAIIFSHSECYIFTLLIDSFVVQKLLSLIRPNLFIFISITLGGGSQRILLWFMSRGMLPMCSLSFIVSDLIFKSLIPFEFIFVVGAWFYLWAFLFHCSIFLFLCQYHPQCFHAYVPSLLNLPPTTTPYLFLPQFFFIL